ncbi:MAG: S8 family serine peptidase [Actinomycetota bacterium]|nr:S8 family serine peptidase [Actinomycetota bacterium]
MFPFARRLLLTLLILPALLGLPAVASAGAQTDGGTARLSDSRYLIVLDTSTTAAQARSLVTAAGGTVAANYTRQMGVLVAESTVSGFAAVLRASSLVDEVGADFSWKGLPGGGPEPSQDPLESEQWDMQQIRTEQAHAVQAGARAVDVGILDSGTDGRHPDFMVDGQASNVDCARGRDFVLGNGPGVGNPDPCTDNQFHGTHVSGTVGAQANGIGIVGVAPNVTLVPVKVCDTTGYCYASSVVDGITYAGDAQLDVINMSFFVDDNEFQESTEFKCNSDPVQRAFRKAVERAVQYARSQGVTPVAALGNSDTDLAHPEDDQGVTNECEVVPAETQGVIGVASLGRNSEKAGYSNYGTGATDITAPGGNGTTGDCRRTVLSTFPGGGYVCIQGTSMASPHAAGVAALIVSQIGTLGADGDVKASPTKVEALVQNTAIDIGLWGYDECFGNGRIDALRAVTADTSRAADPLAPNCPEYNE